jgi:hypothetical protein
VDGKKKEADDKEVSVDLSNPDQHRPRSQIGTHTHHFSPGKSGCLRMSDIRYAWDPREVIEHKLGIDPSYKLIKQRERRYTPERCETIR